MIVKRDAVKYLLVGLITMALISILMVLRGPITGYAVYQDYNENNFSEGTYSNTEYNGSAIILSSGQTSGTYTSQIFDASNDAVWNNISWVSQTTSSSNSQLTSAMHLDTNRTTVFVKDETYYLADMKDASKGFYLNFSENLIDESVLKIYAKRDKGITIGIYAQSDVNGDNALGTFSVDSTTGAWYNITLDIVTPTNSIWIGEGTGSEADPKDEFDYIYAEIPGTTLNFQIRTCNDDACSGESWTDITDTSPQDLSLDNNRYFQYQVNFTSPDSSISPSLESVDIDYTEPESDSPNISYSEDTTNEGDYSNVDSINVGVDLSDENQIYSFINFNNSLVGFWKLNESSGNIIDYSGYGNEGVVSGATYGVNGKFGDAMSFDGDDAIAIPHSAPISINTPYSISAWIKPSDIGGMSIITSKSETVWEMTMVVYSGVFYAGFENCADDNFFGNGGTITVDNWQHVAYVYNGSRVVGYINGFEVFDVDGSGKPCVGGHSLGIGASQHGISYPFSGSIDEVLIFNRGLSQNEVSQLYSSSSYSENFTNLDYSTYDFYTYTQDIYGNENQTETRTVTLSENAPPTITLVSPVNISYDYNSSIDLNFSVSDADDNLDSCWYNLNTGENISLENCQNTSFDMDSDGNYLITVYANDSNGEVGSDGVSFSIVNSAPSLTLDSPQDGASYGYNESLSLNFSVSDANDNIDSCWYNLNAGENITLGSCANTTIDVPEGEDILIIYANDSLGEEVSDSATFNIAVGAPTIVLISPIDSYLNYQENIQFDYTPTDIDLDNCWLLGDFTGSFEINQTDNSPTSGIVNTFMIDSLNDGTYLWNIGCDDDIGNSAVNGNKTFHIDTTNPEILITEPIGTKTSRTSIPLTFTASDSNLNTCWYNVYRGDSLEVTNTSIACNQSTTIDVTVDADFVLNLFVNDSAGNSNQTNSSFSVDTSTTPTIPPSGGGSSSGGGGGSYTLPVQTGKLEVTEINNIIAYQGDQKTISLNVKNTGKVFLNNCKLLITGEASSWIYSDEIKGIAPGENTDFIFNINIPEEVEAGDLTGELELKCDEASDKQEITISIPSGLELININEIKNTEEGLNILYTLDNSNLIGEQISIEIWILDEEGNEIKRITDDFEINKQGTIEREILIELPRNSIGIYSVYFAISSDLDNFAKQSVVLGKSSTTGMAIFDTTRGKTLSYVLFIALICAGIFFIIRGHGKKSYKKKNHWLLRKRKKK